MSQLWDFPGGIHPQDNKQRSSGRPIRDAGIPPRLILPLQQYIGEPAEPCVAEGERVLKGQTIATVSGGVGVPLHAPTSGTIEAISQLPVPHPSGMSDWCISLCPDGKDQWQERQPCGDYHHMEREQVLQLIREAGIAGLGGAGFPTNIKLRPPQGRKVSTLILNGVECEPYITADDRTMRERPGDVLSGLRVMAWILRPERCVVAIEDNKPEAIAAMRAAAEGTETEIVVIPNRYPAGGEKQLVSMLTGMEVPSGGIPADIGVMCQNVGTAVAVHRAIWLGEPLVSRVITLTGEAVEAPGNFEALIGTPVAYLLEQARLNSSELHRLVMGGPMMGFTLETTSVPAVKTSNCVIAASARELPDPDPEQPCIRCGQCAEVCPMELLPQQLFWHSKAKEFDKAEHLNLFDCIECGACTYVCPSSIPLVHYYRFAKGEIRLHRAEQLRADHARSRFEARQQRLEREQQEKEQRRRERAAAATRTSKKTEEAQPTPHKPQPDQRASKAAQVQEALARKQARAAREPEADIGAKPQAAAETPDLETLEKQLAQAMAKLENMESMLEDARASGADNLEKLERAAAKNLDRVERARAALDDAHQGSTSQSTD